MTVKPKAERPQRRPGADVRRVRPAASERSGPRRDVLMVEVLDAAAILFAAQGFAATSLQDIAKQIGLSRTSMYYYFPSKEALLVELVRGVTERTKAIFAKVADAANTTHSARLTEAARRLVLWVTDPQTLFKLLDRNEHELPEDLAAAHRQTKRRVLDGMAQLVQDGITAGEFRPVNPRVAAFAILGMCNWTAWWFSPAGDMDRRKVADQIAALALGSVQRAQRAAEAHDLGTLLGAIRENLDLIATLEHPPTRRGQPLAKAARQNKDRGLSADPIRPEKAPGQPRRKLRSARSSQPGE